MAFCKRANKQISQKNWSELPIWPMAWTRAMISNHTIRFWEMCIFRSIAYRLQRAKTQRIPFIPEVDFLLFTVCGFANFFTSYPSFAFLFIFFQVSLSFSGMFFHHWFIIQCSSGYRYWITPVNEEETSAIILFLFQIKKKREIINPILDKKRQVKRYKYTCCVQIHMKRFPIQFFSRFFFVDQDRFSMAMANIVQLTVCRFPAILSFGNSKERISCPEWLIES